MLGNCEGNKRNIVGISFMKVLIAIFTYRRRNLKWVLLFHLYCLKVKRGSKWYLSRVLKKVNTGEKNLFFQLFM